MMGVAEGMVALIIMEIRGPRVVNGVALKIRQYACCIHRLLTSFGVVKIIGILVRTGDVTPLGFALYANAGFIEVSNRTLYKALYNFPLNRFELLVERKVGIHESSFAELMMKEMLHHFAHSLIGKELVLTQIDGGRPEFRTVLNRGSDIFRKFSLYGVATSIAVFHFGLVFGDFKAKWRQVVNLPLLMAEDRGMIQS
ncbi:hypothetical protein BG53_13105 [Paenibacillus darwinianus]|uniref:Uncharacterized protein n=1 Tax=Paenibacillus darwinianus TaxID=1380763 RepID=A0A9W5W8E2_9BACL|nr:hypothetical protein CH50_01215 [Paenibacillus darwinianus]EXX90697.1 hypothetical protein BG53_13105 [Paenibacillus darwinianus]EXX90954.1 hypothetical protein BG52_11835 [Paenibacillus darwinianus]